MALNLLLAMFIPFNFFVQKQLVQTQVVQDVLDFVPKSVTQVFYGPVQVMGDVKTPTEVFNEPTQVTWLDNGLPPDPANFYTLLFVDLDAPDTKTHADREYLHWMVLNIPGPNLAGGDVRAAYLGAHPQVGTGYHRMVFQVYRQPAALQFPDPIIANNQADFRPQFNSRNFARRNGLLLVSANFFLTAYDPTTLLVQQVLAG